MVMEVTVVTVRGQHHIVDTAAVTFLDVIVVVDVEGRRVGRSALEPLLVAVDACIPGAKGEALKKQIRMLYPCSMIMI